MIECMVICVLSQAHGSDLRSPDVYLHIMKKLSGNFSLNSARVRALGWPLLCFVCLLVGLFVCFCWFVCLFFRDFSNFLRGVCGANH